jgi:hypothetical protein
MAYAAYIRVYEPVSAFREPDRSRWTAYADSPVRPRRRDSLVAEHAEALRRAIATPQVAAPAQESEHAYIRRADGITYVCPWQTRLRCLLAYDRTRSAGDDQPVASPARLHILGSLWTVPLTWFVPFAPAERWLSLGEGQGRASVAATASAIRALVYTTPMPRAPAGVHLPRSSRRTEYPGASGGEAGHDLPDSYLRIRRDAISVATLTLSDSSRRSNWALRYRNLRLVVDASPLVMAIWSLSGQIWTSPTCSAWSTRQ